MSDDALTAADFLAIVAGTVCLCGHDDADHDLPDPDFKIGEFIEVRGACQHCDCTGELA